MQPGRSAAEGGEECGHRDAVVDNRSACLSQYSPLGSTDSSCSFAGKWGLWTRLVQSLDLANFVLSGCAPSGQARVAGRGNTLRSLECGADGLTRATEFLGDLIEDLPGISAPDDFVNIGEWLLTPPTEGDLVAGSREAIDVLRREVIAGPDVCPRLAGSVPNGGIVGDLNSLLCGELQATSFRLH